MLWLGLPAIAVAVVFALLWHRSGMAARTDASAVADGSVVRIQTGEERMSNGVRCVSFMLELARELPEGQKDFRRQLTSLAGVQFFNDCLMAKMSKGYITTTTNKLRQNFFNMVAQVFTNHIPMELSGEFNGLLLEHNNGPTPLEVMVPDTQLLSDYPNLGLANGFKHAFAGRNSTHVTIDEQYRWISQSPEQAQVLKALEAAFQEAGIKDVEQSDLKDTCLLLGGERAFAFRAFGKEDPARCQTLVEAVEKVLRWRLVNMYGLDEAAAQTVVKAVSKVHVDGFSGAGMQPPSVIR
ncbi:hypothetical protein Cflav_PD6102 [Pedosphaera parvula Ellin514]|uniref:Uncharacterized protein n=2 Tax=Pedosphaera TaxID=1032526 RepID=B9XAC6_PEDPL|nr:hypothetical protein Cflav_PD6102 [Pedosphaera parvula Ellin514]